MTKVNQKRWRASHHRSVICPIRKPSAKSQLKHRKCEWQFQFNNFHANVVRWAEARRAIKTRRCTLGKIFQQSLNNQLIVLHDTRLSIWLIFQNFGLNAKYAIISSIIDVFQSSYWSKNVLNNPMFWSAFDPIKAKVKGWVFPREHDTGHQFGWASSI